MLRDGGRPRTRGVKGGEDRGRPAHDAQILTSTRALREGSPNVPEGKALDTQAGMLSGVSRERSVRSNLCWFTEFCNSQCLSHFAAPFIVVRAEASIADNTEYEDTH